MAPLMQLDVRTAVKREGAALYQAVRERFPGRRSRRISRELRSFILVMPDMLRQIRAWAADDEAPSAWKRLQGYALSYLYSSEDLLPESRQGLLGYLDDAYLIGRVFEMALLRAAEPRLRGLPGQEDLVVQVPRWNALTRTVIPDVADRIDQMLAELNRGETRLFNRILQAA